MLLVLFFDAIDEFETLTAGEVVLVVPATATVVVAAAGAVADTGVIVT